jgi:hypothetical protein
MLLPRGHNPLSHYILYNESEHNILALVGKANKSHELSKLKRDEGIFCTATVEIQKHRW